MNHTSLHYRTMPSPVGELLLVARREAIVGIYFDGADRPPDFSDVRRSTAPCLRMAAEQLSAYFAGSLRRFQLPLDPAGTPFQLRVWERLREIPFGATVSYGEVARGIGHPGASRAVGAANGRNPIAIVVPCHRVIGADGRLTGYGGGLERKQWLLDHEAKVAGSTSRRRVQVPGSAALCLA